MDTRLFFNTETKKSRSFNRYPSDVERREILSTLNADAYVLYLYYLEESNFRKKEIDQESVVSKDLGWSNRKVRDVKGKLSRGGWIHFTKGTDKLGRCTKHYAIGLEEAKESKLDWEIRRGKLKKVTREG